MPSELDTHDILFNPVRKRRAEQAARRATHQPSPAESTPVPSRSDRDAPTTDRPVAYAISEIADADAGPLVSSKLIGGIAVVAAIVTVGVLMRTPELGTSGGNETAADETTWWTAARQQWADENMRTWPLVIRAGRSGAQAAKLSKTPASAPNTFAAPTPARAIAAARSDNPYSTAPPTKPATPTKASDNPYGDSPAPRASKPAAASTDNPY